MSIDYHRLRTAVRQASEHAIEIGDKETAADLSAVLRLLASRQMDSMAEQPRAAGAASR